MIRSRRVLHRGLFIVLAVAIPSSLFIVLENRPTMPPYQDFQPVLFDQAGFAQPAQEKDSMITVSARKKQFELQKVTSGDQPTLLIRPSVELLKPDLLVYWSPVTGTDSDTELAEATLVGRLTGNSWRRLSLPTSAQGISGSLLIYSMAHQQVLDSLSLDQVFRDNIPGG